MGIDLGGTKVEGILLNEGYAILKRCRIPTPSSYNDILGAISHLVEKMDPPEPYSVGVGAPGTSQNGLIRNSNTQCLMGRPLHADMEQVLGRSVHMGNDADCFVAAESNLGAGSGYGVVFGVIMGTGVGGGVAIHGEVWPGRMGAAGEWGHSTLYRDGNPCWCGRRGCVETYLSGPALTRRWCDMGGSPMTIPDILSAKPQGFLKWRDSLVRDFGLALSDVIQVLDPDVVVLGGGLSNIPFLYDMGAAAVHDNTLSAGTPILHNALGDSAGVIGAALL